MAVALVIGSAGCVWSDYDKATAMLGPIVEAKDWQTFVVNDSIPVFPDFIDHVVTLHPNKLPVWANARNRAGRSIPNRVWSHIRHGLVTDVTPDWSGSSGLFAVKIAIQLGITKVILCGVPMDAKEGHILRKTEWGAAKAFTRGWERHFNSISGKVKSFSGWTFERLGAPTQEWITDGK